MEIDTLTRSPLSGDETSIMPTLHPFNLPDLIQGIKHSHSWAKGDLSAMILLRSPEKQIVLTAMHEGTEIVSFQANDSITFQIIEGSIKFSTPKKTVVLDTGKVLILKEKTKYRLTTSEETVFLLSIAKSTLNSTTLYKL